MTDAPAPPPPPSTIPRPPVVRRRPRRTPQTWGYKRVKTYVHLDNKTRAKLKELVVFEKALNMSDLMEKLIKARYAMVQKLERRRRERLAAKDKP